jgi:hypothetical protein
MFLEELPVVACRDFGLDPGYGKLRQPEPLEDPGEIGLDAVPNYFTEPPQFVKNSCSTKVRENDCLTSTRGLRGGWPEVSFVAQGVFDQSSQLVPQQELPEDDELRGSTLPSSAGRITGV